MVIGNLGGRMEFFSSSNNIIIKIYALLISKHFISRTSVQAENTQHFWLIEEELTYNSTQQHYTCRTSLVAQTVKRPPTMQKTQVQSLGLEYLEKEMATYSSILAWKIPWSEEPGRLQSMRSWRVWHDWGTSPSPSYMYTSLELCSIIVLHHRCRVRQMAVSLTVVQAFQKNWDSESMGQRDNNAFRSSLNMASTSYYWNSSMD